MPHASNYLESGVLTHIFRTGTFAKPTVLAFALCANVPDETDTGSLAIGREITGNGYYRPALNPLDANWDFIDQVNGSGHTQNTSEIAWPVATADWGWVSGVAVCDSFGTGSGNMLCYGALATPKYVGQNDQLKLAVGAFDAYLS